MELKGQLCFTKIYNYPDTKVRIYITDTSTKQSILSEFVKGINKNNCLEISLKVPSIKNIKTKINVEVRTDKEKILGTHIIDTRSIQEGDTKIYPLQPTNSILIEVRKIQKKPPTESEYRMMTPRNRAESSFRNQSPQNYQSIKVLQRKYLQTECQFLKSTQQYLSSAAKMSDLQQELQKIKRKIRSRSRSISRSQSKQKLLLLKSQISTKALEFSNLVYPYVEQQQLTPVSRSSNRSLSKNTISTCTFSPMNFRSMEKKHSSKFNKQYQRSQYLI